MQDLESLMRHINPNLLETMVRQGLEHYQPPKEITQNLQPMLEEKVESLLHEKVIPHVGNQGKVYEWMERAQKPFETKKEEEAFWDQVRKESGSEEFVFMLRFGCMDQRDGKGATQELLLRNLFANPTRSNCPDELTKLQ